MSLHIDFAQISWQQKTPYASDFDDIYFIPHHGVAESVTVFLKANDLPQRWHNLQPTQTFTVFETGFGSGLNFLVTFQAWKQYIATAFPCAATTTTSVFTQPSLHFISVEKHPFRKEDILYVAQNFPQFAPCVDDLVQQLYPLFRKGLHVLHFVPGVRLYLWLDDLATIKQSGLPGAHRVDAWFLDGFAPAKNPDMWTEAFFTYMQQQSNPGATFGTFTAAGAVRRSLQKSGFMVHKVKGFGYKRARLQGYLLAKQANHLLLEQQQVSARQLPKSSDASANQTLPYKKPLSVLVAGGGLSGCLTAWALQQRGIAVSLTEPHNTFAPAASGAPKAALDIRLSSDYNVHSQFYLAAYNFALNFYNQHRLQPYWHPTGLLQLAAHAAEQTRQHKFFVTQNPSADLCYPVSQAEASILADMDIRAPALYFPHSGFLSMRACCMFVGQQLAEDGMVVLASILGELIQDMADHSWLAKDVQGRSLGRFDAVVLCNAYQASALYQTNFLPLRVVKGQSTAILSRDLSAPKCVLSNPGNLFPLQSDGKLWLGATYEQNQEDEQVQPDQLKSNLLHWQHIAPALYQDMLTAFAEGNFTGWTAIRCTTPDHLPIVGPVPIAAKYLQDFSFSHRNAKTGQPIDKTIAYYPGLYVNTGHGSRGSCSIPFSAEMIAAMICNEPPCISADIQRYLSPERFLIRQLMKQRNKPG